MTLTTEAAKAYAAELAEETAAADAERTVLRKAATDEAKKVLTRSDGTVVTMTEVGLSAVYADLDEGVVVWSDGTVAIAAQLRDDEWVVRLVEKVDGEWTAVSDRLESLADLGEALAD